MNVIFRKSVKIFTCYILTDLIFMVAATVSFSMLGTTENLEKG
ncbi:MAG: hypothetical protein ACJA2S_000888 [Cyclobacteriaceae bacterium]|jgi:hypothetical protein